MSLTFAFRTSAVRVPEPPKPGIYMPGRNGDAVVLIHGLTGTPTEVRFITWFLEYAKRIVEFVTGAEKPPSRRNLPKIDPALERPKVDKAKS